MSKWAVENIFSAEMIEDFGRDGVETLLETDGRRQASREGVVLPEDSVTVWMPLAWVEEWSDQGGDFVDPIVASTALGRTVVATHERVVISWRVARPAARA